MSNGIVGRRADLPSEMRDAYWPSLKSGGACRGGFLGMP